MVNHVPARESRSRNRCQAELEGMISNINIFMLKIFFFFEPNTGGTCYGLPLHAPENVQKGVSATRECKNETWTHKNPAGCRQHYMMYYTVFRMCGEGICGMVWGEEGGGTRGGRET